MASSADVYKHSKILGSGTVADGTNTITSFTYANGESVTEDRNVQVEITQSGTHEGLHFFCKILDDDDAGTLTMDRTTPYVGA